MPSRFINEIPDDSIEKNEVNFDKEIEDFEFNQDNSLDFESEYRSPGWDRYKKNKKIASIGSWLNENEFQLTNYLYETPVKMTYDFIFSDDGLIVKSTAKNYLGVSNNELILKSIRYE